MKTFTVFQPRMSDEQANAVNYGGWDSEFGKLWLKLTMPLGDGAPVAEILTAADQGVYKKVATVRAADAEDAFRIMNVWPAGASVVRHAKTASMSVGDVLVDDETGETLFCASFGFDQMPRIAGVAFKAGVV